MDTQNWAQFGHREQAASISTLQQDAQNYAIQVLGQHFAYLRAQQALIDVERQLEAATAEADRLRGELADAEDELIEAKTQYNRLDQYQPTVQQLNDKRYRANRTIDVREARNVFMNAQADAAKARKAAQFQDQVVINISSFRDRLAALRPPSGEELAVFPFPTRLRSTRGGT